MFEALNAAKDWPRNDKQSSDFAALCARALFAFDERKLAIAKMQAAAALEGDTKMMQEAEQQALPLIRRLAAAHPR